MGDRSHRPPVNQRQSSREQSNVSQPPEAVAPADPESSYQPQQSSASYHAPFSPPMAQNNPNVPYPPSPHYPTLQSYPPNFQRIPYPTTPPIPLHQYYYSYGQPPLGVPTQYAYRPHELNRSHSDASQSYSDLSQQPRHGTPGPNAPSMASVPYARMTYAAPIPYPYSMAPPSIPTLPPVYASTNTFSPPVAQMDTSPEYWYTSTNTPPALAESDPSTSHPAQSMSSSQSITPVRLPDPSRASTSSRSQSWAVQPDHPAPSGASVARSGQETITKDWATRRRPHQPHPPANRSEWVMWVGNIPSDCDRDELQRFFDSVVWPSPSDFPEDGGPFPNEAETPRSGVMSVFLISQSNCAFVNYDSEARLLNAVAKCNGVAIRPDDPRCIKLVCRVRKKDEDLRAGVGAQRGVRMHTAWVQQQKQKNKVTPHGEPPHSSLPTMVSNPDSSGPALPSLHEHANTSPITAHPGGSSGSVSFTSTNSSFLTTYFPQRYFILKSLTLDDLNFSVERRAWATQPHNEDILDQAYRTSKEVFLIFGANKTGEFFGFAKMAGPIVKSGSAPDSSTTHSPVTQSSAPAAAQPPTTESSSLPSGVSQPSAANRFLLSPNAPLQESPAPVSPSSPLVSKSTRRVNVHADSAPPELGEPFRRISLNASPVHASTFEEKPTFQLDSKAPLRAIRAHDTRAEHLSNSIPSEKPTVDEDPTNVSANISVGHVSPTSSGKRPQVSPVQRYAGSDPGGGPDRAFSPASRVGWGTSFPVMWIRVQPLSFTKTRHLRNPWNADREVKVSRDGTELEPNVGRQLLAQWDEIPTTPPDPSQQTKKGAHPRSASNRRG